MGRAWGRGRAGESVPTPLRLAHPQRPRLPASPTTSRPPDTLPDNQSIAHTNSLADTLPNNQPTASLTLWPTTSRSPNTLLDN